MPEELTKPFPQQQADPALLSDVLTALEDSMSELREVGHNIIVGALALRAFQISPQLLTPSRATGAIHCHVLSPLSSIHVPHTHLFSLLVVAPELEPSL